MPKYVDGNHRDGVIDSAILELENEVRVGDCKAWELSIEAYDSIPVINQSPRARPKNFPADQSPFLLPHPFADVVA